MPQMQIRAQPFPCLPYHDKTRTDYIMWRTSYSGIPHAQFDLNRPEHVAKVGYGRVILLFKCAIAPNSHTSAEMHELAFIEELWRYTPSSPDDLQDKYGCTLLYRTSPVATFYVIRANEILGPAAICRNTAPARIPVGGLGRVAERGLQSQVNPCARADKGPDDTSGSELYRLNIWHMMWGSMIAVQPLAYRLDRPVTEEQPDRTLRVPGRSLLPY
jgi:hypothetical protein